MKLSGNLLLLFPLLCGAVAVLSGFGVRMEWWGYMLGFKLLQYAAMAALIGGLVSLVLLIVRRAKSKSIDGQALCGVALGCLIAGTPFTIAKEFRETPTLGDAATDFDNLPSFEVVAEARKAAAEDPPLFTLKEAEEAQKKYFPEIEPIEVDASPEEVKATLVATLEAMQFSLAESGSDPLKVEATQTSFWFGFKDDVLVVIEAGADGGSKVNVRSASRVGKFDGGANAKRVNLILTALQQP